MFDGLHHWHWALRGVALGVLGGVVGLGHAPIDWPVMTVLGLAAFLALSRGVTDMRTALWHGWAFGAGYFAFTLRWIVSPFLVHVAQDGWMAPFAMAGMAGGMAVFWMLAAGLAFKLRPGCALLLAAFIVLAEATRALTFTGFPWGLLGHVLVETPLAQLAAFVGPHGLSAVVAAVSWAVSTPFAWRSGKAAFVVFSVPLLMSFLVLALWALLPLGVPAPEAADDAPIVRLVQPNAPQDQKWDPAYTGVFFDRMLGYTGDGAVPDLVVWPESAIPDLLNYAQASLNLISDAARGAPVIVGVNRREGARFYNGFVSLGRGGLISRVYDKQHLVPFGEYIPGGELLAGLGLHGFAASQGGGFSAGMTDRLVDIPGIGWVRPLICYEGIFAEEIATDTRPRTMVLITNDAWFGQAAGPFQHLAQARLRAIEQGVPMVRVANTGVSAMIDAHGRVTARIALNTAGFVDVALPPVRAVTLYHRWGDWPAVLVVLLTATACFVTHGRKTS